MCTEAQLKTSLKIYQDQEEGDIRKTSCGSFQIVFPIKNIIKNIVRYANLAIQPAIERLSKKIFRRL